MLHYNYNEIEII